MSDMTREQVIRLLGAEIEKLGLTRLTRMFAVEHNVPRGTHKLAAGGDAETLEGNPASAFAPFIHTHIGGDVTSQVDDSGMLEGHGADDFFLKNAVPWGLIGWSHRLLLRIKDDYIDGALTDFPLCVQIAGNTDIGGDALSTGYDIRFTAADGVTELSFERESFAVAGGEATGVFWAKVPSLPTTGAYLWMYWGNASAADASDPDAVWDTDYAAVYHMADATTSTILDSTANANTGTKKGGGEPVEATGKVGKGQDFDGADDYVDANGLDSYADGKTAIGIGCWVKFSAPKAAAAILGWWWNHAGHLRLDGAKLLFSFSNAGGDVSVTSPLGYDDGKWHLVTGTYDAGAGSDNVRLYVDGQLVAVATTTGALVSPEPFNIGSINNLMTGTYNFDGLIDEVRISSVARSAAWLKFEYHNMADADGCLEWGEEEIEADFAALANHAHAGMVTGAYDNDFRALYASNYRIPVLEQFSWQPPVLAQQNDPPASPTKGDRYIVGNTPTGAWAGYAWSVATYDGAAWILDVPAEGWIAYSEATNDLKLYDGSVWGSLTLAEGGLSLSDVTIGDVSTSKHGFAPKAPNDTSKFLRGDGSWAAPAGGGLGYCLAITSTNISTMAGGATYYFSGYAFAPATTADQWRLYIPKAGTIKAAYVNMFAGTTAGSNESISMYIRKNNSADTLIASVGSAGANRTFSNTGLSISVAAGDYIEIKLVCPTWATNPAGVRFSGSIYIE